MAAVNRNLEQEFDQAAYEADLEYHRQFDFIETGDEHYQREKKQAFVHRDVIVAAHIFSKTEKTGVFDCPICLDENIPRSKRVTIVPCNHNFCMDCTVKLLKTHYEKRTDTTCPMCRYPCFLLETPDETQVVELGHLIDVFAELDTINDEDLMEAFRYYHLNF
jgi:hypothetical protein